MRTVAFELLNKKFDDQYTFDLQGYLTFHDFNSHMKAINRGIKNTPLPRHFHLWMKLLWMVWVASACLFYVVYMHDLPLWILFLLSSSLLSATFLVIYYCLYSVSKFEQTILEACAKLNMAGKANGISYQLVKNNQTCHSPHIAFSWGFLFGTQSAYHIAVQFDDRYDQRYSKEFVSVPLYPGRAVLAENEKSDDISTPFLSDHDEKV